MLENDQRFYEMQNNLWTQNQSTIYDWIDSYTKLGSGHMIAKVTQWDSKNKHAGIAAI